MSQQSQKIHYLVQLPNKSIIFTILKEKTPKAITLQETPKGLCGNYLYLPELLSLAAWTAEKCFAE